MSANVQAGAAGEPEALHAEPAGGMGAAADMHVIDDYLDALLDDAPPGVAAVVAPLPSPMRLVPALDADDAPAAAIAVRPAQTTTAEAAVARDAAPAPAGIVLATSCRWLRVTVSEDSYALELLRVQEVVRLVPIVAMRGARRAILGVMNLRGRIVPVLDLGLWFGTCCVQADERSRIVVVERDDELIGLLVSAVEDVVTLGRERIEPPLPGSDPGAILGVARVGATPTVLFDANALYG
jgi:purine-binding chemotaxis protein CheW